MWTNLWLCFKKNALSFFFGLSVFLALIVVLAPILIKNDCIRDTVLCILDRMKGLKGSYLEVLGALFGSFLAITGALWAQRLMNGEEEKQRIRENAIIVYNDLLLGIVDLRNVYIGKLLNNSTYGPSRMYFSDKWIENVAILSNDKNINDDDIRNLYLLYGDLNTVKEYLSVDRGPILFVEVSADMPDSPDKKLNDSVIKAIKNVFKRDFTEKLESIKNVSDLDNCVTDKRSINRSNELKPEIATLLELVEKIAKKNR